MFSDAIKRVKLQQAPAVPETASASQNPLTLCPTSLSDCNNSEYEGDTPEKVTRFVMTKDPKTGRKIVVRKQFDSSALTTNKNDVAMDALSTTPILNKASDTIPLTDISAQSVSQSSKTTVATVTPTTTKTFPPKLPPAARVTVSPKELTDRVPITSRVIETQFQSARAAHSKNLTYVNPQVAAPRSSASISSTNVLQLSRNLRQQNKTTIPVPCRFGSRCTKQPSCPYLHPHFTNKSLVVGGNMTFFFHFSLLKFDKIRMTKANNHLNI